MNNQLRPLRIGSPITLKTLSYESANDWDKFIIRTLPVSNISHSSVGVTNSTRSTTLGRLPSIVTWGVMIILVLVHRSIGHSNILFSSLLVMHLGISILGTSSSWVPVRVPLGTFPHILTRFTTAVTVSRDYILLRISTSANPASPTIAAPTWWRWSSLGEIRHGSSHISGDSLTHHGFKRQRLSREVSLVSSGESRFSSRCSRPRAKGLVFSTKTFLVLG